MWVPKALLELFSIGRETVDTLRTDLATTRATNQSLERELAAFKVNFDWIRIQVNTLQVERTILMEKAYGMKIPTPELIQLPTRTEKTEKSFSFEDVGEDLAKTLGFPSYAKQ